MRIGISLSPALAGRRSSSDQATGSAAMSGRSLIPMRSSSGTASRRDGRDRPFRPVEGSARSDFLSVAREAAPGGNQVAAVSAGVSNRPAPGPPQVVGVDALGHAEFDEIGADRVRADEDVASEALVSAASSDSGWDECRRVLTPATLMRRVKSQ